MTDDNGELGDFESHSTTDPTTTPENADDPEAVDVDDVDDGPEYEPGQKRPLDHGVKVRAKVKRGTGTRDQDELLLEGRGESAAEAALDFEESLQWAEEHDWTDRLRALQPGADDAGEDGDGDE